MSSEAGRGERVVRALQPIVRQARQARVTCALAERNAVASGIDVHQATDIICTLMSPEVYRILTVERGWSGGDYQHWLARALRAMLLGDASPGDDSPARMMRP